MNSYTQGKIHTHTHTHGKIHTHTHSQSINIYAMYSPDECYPLTPPPHTKDQARFQKLMENFLKAAERATVVPGKWGRQ